MLEGILKLSIERRGLVMIFVLLWAYFRRWHGVLIPAVAALATTIWGLGFTG